MACLSGACPWPGDQPKLVPDHRLLCPNYRQQKRRAFSCAPYFRLCPASLLGRLCRRLRSLGSCRSYRRRSIGGIAIRSIAIGRITPGAIVVVVTVTPVVAAIATTGTGSVHAEIEITGTVAPTVPPVIPAAVAPAIVVPGTPPSRGGCRSCQQRCNSCNLDRLFHGHLSFWMKRTYLENPLDPALHRSAGSVRKP